MLKNIILTTLIFLHASLSLLAQQSTFVLEDLNPSKFKLDFSNYDQETAIFCAQLSNLVYYDQAEIDVRVEALKAKYPEHDIRYKFFFTPHKFYPLTEEQIKKGWKRKALQKTNTETEVLVFGTKDFVVIAYRGTYSAKDGWTDARIKSYVHTSDSAKIKYRNLLAGHAGFRKSIMDVIDRYDFFNELHEFIAHYKKEVVEMPVYVTGHSLGGALATMTIKPLQFNNQFKFGGAYTFAPALGISCSEVDQLANEKDRIHNIVNHTDIVSRINYKKYRHIGQFYRFSHYRPKYNSSTDGALYKEKVRFVRFTRSENLRIKNTILKYHSLDRYVEKIKLETNSNKAVEIRGDDKNPATEHMKWIEYPPCKFNGRLSDNLK